MVPAVDIFQSHSSAAISFLLLLMTGPTQQTANSDFNTHIGISNDSQPFSAKPCDTAKWYLYWSARLLLAFCSCAPRGMVCFCAEDSRRLPAKVQSSRLEEGMLTALLSPNQRGPGISASWMLWDGTQTVIRSPEKCHGASSMCPYPGLISRCRGSALWPPEVSGLLDGRTPAPRPYPGLP